MKQNLFPALILICLCAAMVAAQTSAFTYQGRLTDANLPANGAYQFQFKLFDAAAGGSVQNSRFSIYSGFLTPSVLAPTAATVSVGGRVLLVGGQGVRNVLLTLTNSRGETRNAVTGTFGYYHFTEVTVGETYVLELRSKRFVFANPVRIISVTDELANIDFVTEE